MEANPINQSKVDYISPSDASRATGLSTRQLGRLADAGKLRAIRPGMHRRYLASDVAALVASEPWDPAA